ncbi:hypothetical protein [Olivibacter sitiensis]|uniref:hypothetical protein n=1 Tax=Olivibacter sitiensis TaxID=376470 RepID=UPI0003FBE2E7|nr:hypothetical protein [Olivibacter sitiensis]
MDGQSGGHGSKPTTAGSRPSRGEAVTNYPVMLSSLPSYRKPPPVYDGFRDMARPTKGVIEIKTYYLKPKNMVRILNARLYIVASLLILLFISFFMIRSLMAGEKEGISNETAENEAVQTNYVWYQTPGNQVGCSTSGMDRTLYPVEDYETVDDLPQTPNPAVSCSGTAYCCAKGYVRNETNFTIENIDGVEYWVPSSNTADAERSKN